MKMPLTISTGMMMTGLGALAFLGTLSGCGPKADGTQDQTVPNAAAGAAAAGANQSAAATADDDMATEMDELHRQEMDHRDMRQGGSTMPDAAPADMPATSPDAPMKDAPMKDAPMKHM